MGCKGFQVYLHRAEIRRFNRNIMGCKELPTHLQKWHRLDLIGT